MAYAARLLPAGVTKLYLRSDTAGYQQDLVKYCAEGKNERFGVIEFAVADMRKAIRAIGETEGVRGVHFIAHSRGTDVLASAFQQLGGEAYVSRSSITESLRVRNIVLFAPDIDIDVGATKIFDVFSDPDTAYGAKENPNATIKRGSFHGTGER